MRLKKRYVVVAALVGAIAAISTVAYAGSPHFVTADATRTDNTLTVTFKEAGLGDEPQVHIVLSATALCINNGGKHPKAVNKASVSAADDFPVQNGKAEGGLAVGDGDVPA
jgi:hypothetical protein